MKKTFLILITFIFTLVVFNCNSDDDSIKIQYESTAKIIGQDLTLCACCGGWIIEIDGASTSYRFEELPQGSNVNLEQSNLPVDVQLNWTIANDCTSIVWITIDDIVEIN